MAWITTDDVREYLGAQQPGAAIDEAWLTRVTAAGDSWAQRTRAQAGYVDDPATAPGPDAEVGATMYAAALYRDRGSGDGWAAYAEFPAAPPAGLALAQINRLLGVPRVKAF